MKKVNVKRKINKKRKKSRIKKSKKSSETINIKQIKNQMN